MSGSTQPTGRHEQPAASTAHDAADAILYDLSGRAGFDAWWEDIAPDVKDDIRDAIAQLIEAVHVR